jgi:hypothetical protein
MQLNSPERNSKGELIAEALSGAWRSDSPPPLEISSDELERIAPLLLNSGAAALAWRRIHHTDLRASPTANEFYQVYRFQTLQARIDQRKIEQVFKLLRSVQVEPILVKGWAIARLYPKQGLRPYGDIDVCVREEQSATAEAALKTPEGRQYLVDLHRGFAKLGGGGTDALYARSQLVRLGETDVRVLGPEDHLRVLCFHLLREGAWRPLWLCDIAVALESRHANFDWEHCFAGTKRSRELIFCAIGLAHRLLSADVDDIPFAESVKQLPTWAVPTVLSEWASLQPSMTQRHLAPMITYWHHPSGVLKGLRNRWPNPVEATIVAGGPFNDLPRLPLQIRSYLAHATSFLARRLKLLRVRNE